jgi:diaminobutyrate-2-oxoglutarate transaminase
MALTLVRPQYDCFEPGEHNGTFRGHNLAFITAAKALDFWADDHLANEVQRKAALITTALSDLATRHPQAEGELRGRGLMQGIALNSGELAGEICAKAFEKGLIMETSGPDGEVVKLLPPLTISDADLLAGLKILAESFAEVIGSTQQSTLDAA